MTVLTRKCKEFIWGPKQQEAFQTMKDTLCNAPALAYPNFNLPFILSTDASRNSLGAILSQVQDGLEKPWPMRADRPTEASNHIQLLNLKY